MIQKKGIAQAPGELHYDWTRNGGQVTGTPSKPTAPIALDTFPDFSRNSTEAHREQLVHTSLLRYTVPRDIINKRILRFLS